MIDRKQEVKVRTVTKQTPVFFNKTSLLKFSGPSKNSVTIWGPSVQYLNLKGYVSTTHICSLFPLLEKQARPTTALWVQPKGSPLGKWKELTVMWPQVMWETLGRQNTGEIKFSNMFLSLEAHMNQPELSAFLELIKTSLYDYYFMFTSKKWFKFLLQVL